LRKFDVFQKWVELDLTHLIYWLNEFEWVKDELKTTY